MFKKHNIMNFSNINIININRNNGNSNNNIIQMYYVTKHNSVVTNIDFNTYNAKDVNKKYC